MMDEYNEYIEKIRAFKAIEPMPMKIFLEMPDPEVRLVRHGDEVSIQLTTADYTVIGTISAEAFQTMVELFAKTAPLQLGDNHE